MDSKSSRTCLVVDDDEVLRNHLGRALEKRGLAVTTAGSGEKALELIADPPQDLAVIDLRMPGMNGLDLLRRLRQRCPDMRVVVLTGYGSIANAVAAVQAGAVNYVTKPATASEILAAFDSFRDSEAPLVTESLEAPSLAEVEWNHIQRVLEECDGNISMASRVLGIPRRTLYRKLKKRAP